MNSRALSTCQLPAPKWAGCMRYLMPTASCWRLGLILQKQELTELGRLVLALPLPGRADLNLRLNPSEPQNGGQGGMVLVPSTSKSSTPSVEGAHMLLGAIKVGTCVQAAHLCISSVFLNLESILWSIRRASGVCMSEGPACLWASGVWGSVCLSSSPSPRTSSRWWSF